MNQDKAILTAFLEDALQAYELTIDEETVDVLYRHIQLIERPPDESKETRAITMNVDSDGSISATSFKLYNIAQISTYDLLEFLAKEIGIALFDDTSKKIIYSFLMLLIDFSPKFKVKFNNQDAQILWGISLLKKKQFAINELTEKLEEILEEPIPKSNLDASIEKFIEHRVLKRTAADEYQIREKIKNLTRA